MADAMSEIILCEDSEITAATAVVNEFGSPVGLRYSSTAAAGRHHFPRQKVENT